MGTIVPFNSSSEVYPEHLFPYLNVRDLVTLGTVNKELGRLFMQFVALSVQGPSIERIIGEYGHAPLGNARNLAVLSRAYEACRFEGAGEGLSRETLGAKMQIVEDRNLVKMYLRYINMSNPPPLRYTRLHADHPRDWESEAALLSDHPELRTCCLANVTNISVAARAIRERLQSGEEIRSLYEIEFDSLAESDGAGHFHDRDISIIPPEVRYFRTREVNVGCRLLLISQKLAMTFNACLGAHYWNGPELNLRGTANDRRATQNAIPGNVQALTREKYIADRLTITESLQ